MVDENLERASSGFDRTYLSLPKEASEDGAPGVDKRLLQPEFAACQEVFAQRAQDAIQHAGLSRLLEAPMAGLVGTVSRRKIVPRRTGPQDPQHAIQYAASIAEAASPAVGPLPVFLFPLHKGPQILPLRIGEISHALCLHQLHVKSNRLFTSDVGEIGSRLDGAKESLERASRGFSRTHLSLPKEASEDGAPGRVAHYPET
jgi:hypothetical protein